MPQTARKLHPLLFLLLMLVPLLGAIHVSAAAATDASYSLAAPLLPQAEQVTPLQASLVLMGLFCAVYGVVYRVRSWSWYKRDL